MRFSKKDNRLLLEQKSTCIPPGELFWQDEWIVHTNLSQLLLYHHTEGDNSSEADLGEDAIVLVDVEDEDEDEDILFRRMAVK